MYGIKRAVFDWDGTAFKSTKRNHHATSGALQDIFGHAMSFGEFRSWINFPTSKMYQRYCKAHGIDPEELKVRHDEERAAFNRHYNAWPHAIGTTPGTRDALHWLRAHHIPSDIVSNHDAAAIRADLKRLHLAPLFKDVSGRPDHLDIAKGSNKLERVARILKKHGVRPEEVVIFGDSLQEIDIARKLGMRVISVGCGDTAPWRLVRARPDAYVPTLAHAVPVLARWCDNGSGRQRAPEGLHPRIYGF